jgi:hypothetical protein
MQQKLALGFAFVCVVIAGESAPLLGAEDKHTHDPKLDSAQQVQSASPEATSKRPDTDHRAPTTTPAEEKLKQMEKRCSWDIAATAGCQPPPGSPLSAFPLVSHTEPPLKGNRNDGE